MGAKNIEQALKSMQEITNNDISKLSLDNLSDILSLMTDIMEDVVVEMYEREPSEAHSTIRYGFDTHRACMMHLWRIEDGA